MNDMKNESHNVIYYGGGLFPPAIMLVLSDPLSRACWNPPTLLREHCDGLDETSKITGSNSRLLLYCCFVRCSLSSFSHLCRSARAFFVKWAHDQGWFGAYFGSTFWPTLVKITYFLASFNDVLLHSSLVGKWSITDLDLICNNLDL